MTWDPERPKADQIMEWVLADDVLQTQRELLPPDEAEIAWQGVQLYRTNTVRQAMNGVLTLHEAGLRDTKRTIDSQITDLQTQKRAVLDELEDISKIRKLIDSGAPFEGRSHGQTTSEAASQYAFLPPVSFDTGITSHTQDTSREYIQFRVRVQEYLGTDVATAGRVTKALIRRNNLRPSYFEVSTKEDDTRVIKFLGTGEQPPGRTELFHVDRRIGEGTVRLVLELFRVLGLEQADEAQADEEDTT